jgi:hypothetical protein
MTKPALIGAGLGFAIGYLAFSVWACCGMDDFDVYQLPEALFWFFLIYLVSVVWFFPAAVGGFFGSVASCFIEDLSAWQRARRLALVSAITLLVLYVGGRMVIMGSPFATAW